MLLVVSATVSNTAVGQNSGSFTLKISEKEMKLEHPTDMMWDKYLMWDLAFQRMNDRNMPYIELANAASSTAPITELHLTIGDTRFNFSDDVMGTFAMLGSSTPDFDITSNTVGGLGDELVVNIGGGLQPGQLLRFKIDLAVDPQFADQFFPHPDYRTVLFDMNGLNVYDNLQQLSAADNAMVWVIFDPAIGANFETQSVAFQDEIVPGPAANYFNDNYRRDDKLDPVRTFQLTGGQTSVVPEPGCSILASISLLAGMLFTGRSRILNASEVR
jgi:hypothetical protein